MNDDDNFIHKYYATLFLSNKHEDISSISEHESEIRTVCHHKNTVLDLLLKKSKSFEWQV